MNKLDEEITGYVFTDLETTGLEPTVHGIVQIASIITDLQFRVQSVFMSYVKPDHRCEINPEALKICQLSEVDIDCAPDETFVARAFQNFLYTGGPRLRFAGYNCPFDISFLVELFYRCNIKADEFYDVDNPLDLLWECKKRFKKPTDVPNHKLTTMGPHVLGADFKGQHDALGDIHQTLKIARRLLVV